MARPPCQKEYLMTYAYKYMWPSTVRRYKGNSLGVASTKILLLPVGYYVLRRRLDVRTSPLWAFTILALNTHGFAFSDIGMFLPQIKPLRAPLAVSIPFPTTSSPQLVIPSLPPRKNFRRTLCWYSPVVVAFSYTITPQEQNLTYTTYYLETTKHTTN